MTRRLLALSLTTVLSLNCFGQTSPKQQASAIASNSPVEVKFVDGIKQQGWISEVTDNGFVLTHEKKRLMEKTQVIFAQVTAVKQIKEVKPTHKTRNIFIGVGIVWAVLTIISAAALGR